MAAIYSEQIFFKSVGVAGPVVWDNPGAGTYIIHDMVYFAGDNTIPFGKDVAILVQSLAFSCTYWSIPCSAISSRSTAHWTGRIVCPQFEEIEVSTMSPNDSFIMWGYHLVP